MPANRALLVASAPKEDGGAALGALGALESASGLVAPVWLGYLYAYGARHSRAADAFYGTVATAALAFVSSSCGRRSAAVAAAYLVAAVAAFGV